MQEENQAVRPLQLKGVDRSLAQIDPSRIWGDDALDRSRDARNLESLIAGQSGPLTLCLDGAWGTGKTFFLRRFKVQWESNGGTALYFNAWEDDNLDDPLFALIGQLWPLLKPDGMKVLVDDIKKCAIPLFKKAAIAKLGVEEKDVSTPAANLFDEYTNLQSSRQQFKQTLSKAARQIYENSSNRPLLFIIDELDRCRPSFAVELLERIKHLFPIEHIVFLVGVDREQVKASVRAVYGDIDAENYLHRFFDVTVTLRQYTPSQFVFATYGYTSSREMSPATLTVLRTRFNFAQKFCTLIRHFNMSLREVEVAMRTYTLLISSHAETVSVMMCGLLIALKMKNRVSYSHFVNWDLPIGKLVDSIFGDLLEYDDLTDDSSPISFIRYLYQLEMSYGEGSQQQQELIDLIKRLENGSKYDINSPIIPEFLRSKSETEIKDFFSRVKQFSRAGHYDFRRALHNADEQLQQLGDY